MYVILWEFVVASAAIERFSSVYSPAGEWAQLFALAPGYLGTELLQSPDEPNRFLTIDRWQRAEDFESFKQKFGAEYAALDLRCAGLTVAERKLGAYTGALS